MPLRYDDTLTTMDLQESDADSRISDREFVSLVTRFARQGTWRVDIESSHFWVSRGVCEIFDIDYNEGPVNLLSFRERLHDEDRDILHEALAMASERQCSFAAIYRVKSGECHKFVRTVGRFRETESGSGELVGVTFEIANHVREIVFGP